MINKEKSIFLDETSPIRVSSKSPLSIGTNKRIRNMAMNGNKKIIIRFVQSCRK